MLATIIALAFFWAPAGAMLSEAAEAGGLDQGLAFGVMNLAWAGGQVVGGGASASLADLTSDAVPYALLASLCLITLVLARQARSRLARFVPRLSRGGRSSRGWPGARRPARA